MTDAERLEKWYAEQNLLPGIKSIFKNVYGNYYVQDHEEPVLYGIPDVYRVEGDNFIFVTGKKKTTSYGCMQVHPSQLNRKKYQTS